VGGVNYPLVDELAAETADDDVFARYPVADRASVETLIFASRRALAQAPPNSRATPKSSRWFHW